MPRAPRVDFPGARHHVMNRASRRENIFLDPYACELFLSLLAELPERFRVRVLAYAIMPNHYHLLVECPEGNLSRAMKFLGAEFTQRLNRRNGWDGPIFRGRFKSRLVTTDAYLAHLFAYIHLNPVNAGLVNTADEASLTSHRALVGLETPPPWLDVSGLTGSFENIAAYLCYLHKVQVGDVEIPPDWAKLWSRVRPEHPLVAATPVDVDGLVERIADVAGVWKGEVLRSTQPPSIRRLAAWALTQHLPNVEAAKLLGCSPGRVSQLRADAKRQAGLVERWRTARQHPRQETHAHEPPPRAYVAGGSYRRSPAPRGRISSPPSQRRWYELRGSDSPPSV